ncbi:MAG: Na/Pi cotransporter family protein [Clostridia bacterium]|nr:Na/Pi cotransporter family protein [Clostridia bacterium]
MELKLFESVFILISGLGIFLGGMKLMGIGLERSASGSVKKISLKLSNKIFPMYWIGAGTTALVQSSGATTVMSMGFVTAGMMTTVQACAFVLGARLGTTVTGILASLSSVSITPILMSLGFVGVILIIFAKNDILNNIGMIVGGFGILFAGMYLMKISISANEEMTTAFTNLFNIISNPMLLLLIGIVVTVLLQSSSSAIGIILVMINAGTLPISSAISICIGTTIGTCSTAIFASLGAEAKARRVSLFNVITAIIGAIIIGTPIIILREYIVQFLQLISKVTAWQLSLFSVMYSFVISMLMMPFIKPLTKLCEKIIKEKQKKKFSVKYIDYTIIDRTPSLGVILAKKEAESMLDLAIENLENGINAILEKNIEKKNEIKTIEEQIDYLTEETGRYLIEISGLGITQKDTKMIGSLHHVLDDIERIGDHGWEFFKEARVMDSNGVEFSDSAKKDLKEMFESVKEMYRIAREIFTTENEKMLPMAKEQRENTKIIKRKVADNHVNRLGDGCCNNESSTFFYTAITSLERVCDHLENIAFSLQSISGFDKDKKI